MESRPLKRRLVFGGVAIVVIAALLAWRLGPWATDEGRDRGVGRTTSPVRPLVPAGTRIRVEVINTTDIRGLGRRATMYLRDRGFDVVRYAGERPERDSTLILDRVGNGEWGALLQQALDGAALELRPDSSRYVDFSVLIGRSWRPPAEPFYP